MRIVIAILACISFLGTPYVGATSAEVKRSNIDLVQFEYPFMIGDWYLAGRPNHEEEIDFLAIRLNIASDYRFNLEIQNRDLSIDTWQGDYSVNRDTLTLGLNSEDPQIYRYLVNHNQLFLNGVPFVKGYKSALVGSWSSIELKGDDILASNVSRISLTLQADFVFYFMSESDSGDIAVYQGVYYFEGEHLVLVYEKGEQESRFKVKDNTLTLESAEVDMYAVMYRVQ